MSTLSIHSLTRATASRIRSSTIIPTFPSILDELVQNAIDAGAKRVQVWIDLSPGNEGIRVEDDGQGINREDMKVLGVRFSSSKDASAAASAPKGTHAFRGEALASIAALALLEISSKTESSEQTVTKIIKVLYEGSSHRSVQGSHGTTVSVKDLFHNIPVRQASLAASSSTTTMATCRRFIEVLALAHPGVDFALWEQRIGRAGPSTSTGPKLITSVKGGKSSLEVFRSIHGGALVERVQKVRVTSGQRRIDGFISLQGGITKGHQYLYVNHLPAERNELHAAISKRFANSRFSRMTADDQAVPENYSLRRSPRRLERYPVYVLNITLPPDEVDAAYEPGKRLIGFHDPHLVVAFVLAVIDEFLKRHDFVAPSNGLDSQRSPSRPSRSNAPTGESGILSPIRARGLATPTPISRTCSVASSILPQKRRLAETGSIPRPITPSMSVGRGSVVSSGRLTVDTNGTKKSKWIEKLLKSIEPPILPFSPASYVPPSNDEIRLPSGQSEHKTRFRPSLSAFNSQVSFSPASLATGQILGQVEHKFVVTILDATTDTPGDTREIKSLVLVDQHAADERIAVERLLIELCEGFRSDSIPLQTTDIGLVVTREEYRCLRDPLVKEILARWGFRVEHNTDDQANEGDHVQIKITTCPRVLPRLRRKDPVELSRLIKQHVPFLRDHMGELSALVSEMNNDKAMPIDWGRICRYMPREMMELVNSKACRGAIMFGDELSLAQCTQLLSQLADTRSPFICAHGRPSLVPVTAWVKDGVLTRRRKLDWARLSNETPADG